MISLAHRRCTKLACSTYQPLLDALEPLRSAGYLTTFKDGSLTQGAVTVVGTGNTPLESVIAAEPRDFFYDANILTLYSTKPADGKEWGPEIAPLASCQWSKVDGVRTNFLTACLRV